MSNEELIKGFKKKFEAECQRYHYQFTDQPDILELKNHPRTVELGEFSYEEADKIFASFGDVESANLKEMCKSEGIVSCERVKLIAIFTYDGCGDTIYAHIVPKPVMDIKFKIKFSLDGEENEE